MQTASIVLQMLIYQMRSGLLFSQAPPGIVSLTVTVHGRTFSRTLIQVLEYAFTNLEQELPESRAPQAIGIVNCLTGRAKF